MRALATAIAVSAVLLAMSGCAGSEKGNGISRLDTITQEDKEEAAWFGSFYGKNHCGVWEGSCEPGADTGGNGGGGMWNGGVGPTDSGASHDSGSSSSSDSGSSN